MSGHGPDAATFEKAIAADTSQPAHVTDTMAFMFESRTRDQTDPLRDAGPSASAKRLHEMLARSEQAL